LRSKIIIVFLAMVSLVGIAGADQINVYDPGTTDEVTSMSLTPGGQGVVKDLVISAFINDVGTSHNLTTEVYVTNNPGGAADPSDIVVEFKERGTSPNCGSLGCNVWGGSPFNWKQDSGSSETLDVKFSAKAGAPSGAKYLIEIKDQASGSPFKISVIVATTNIPEFPTVALPVAGVIGLVYLLNFRKKKQ